MSMASDASAVGGIGDEAPSDALRALAQSLLTSAEPAAGPEVPSADRSATTIVLSLDDLISDPSGEVVLSVGPGPQCVVLEGPSQVAERGVTGPHSTAGGENVVGMGYLVFSDGPTLYFPLSVQVTVGPSEG
jgi:hypothetical protein